LKCISHTILTIVGYVRFPRPLEGGGGEERERVVKGLSYSSYQLFVRIVFEDIVGVL
jgi:hypothetical protein